MIKLIILTHGSLGIELLKTCEMIIGKQDKVDVLTVQNGFSLSDIASRLDELIAANTTSGVLIFTDMFGGSPSNIAMAYLGQENVEVLTGVNLPMLLKAFSSREADVSIKEFAEGIQQSGLESIILAGDILKR